MGVSVIRMGARAESDTVREVKMSREHGANRLPSAEPALVRLAASCDNDAFCALRDSYEGHLRRIVARHARERADREDLLADITAKLLHDRKRVLRLWRPIAPFAAYLTTVAVRHCLNWASRRSAHDDRTILASQFSEEPRPGLLERIIADEVGGQPEEIAARGEEREMLHTALMGLSDSDRLVLALRFGDGMSGAAVASTLGISQGAARQRVFKALRRLSTVVAEQGHDFVM